MADVKVDTPKSGSAKAGPVVPGPGGQVTYEVPRGEGNEAEAAKAPASQTADEAFPPADLG